MVVVPYARIHFGIAGGRVLLDRNWNCVSGGQSELEDKDKGLTDDPN